MTRSKPRSVALASSTSGGGSNNRSQRITIKPFSKPPSLPPNYYETSTKELLDATRFLSLMQGKPQQQQNQQQQQQNNNINCLQTSYTSVVHLVSHNLGIQLYQDLRFSMQEAARLVLCPDHHHHHQYHPHHAGSGNGDLLPYVVQQYAQWISYLVLVKHVFLPLDRTHLWNPTLQVAVKGGSSVVNSSRGLTLWGVGLQVFAERLQELQLDVKLYEQWKSAFLEEWREDKSTETHQTELLQSVWYMWGDLGWLSSLPLLQDLEEYWRNVAQDLKQREVPPAEFLQFCVEKHHRVSLWSAWLPCVWLWNILEQQLIAPHLQETILLPNHLHPLLLEQLESMPDSDMMMTTNPMSGGPATPSSSYQPSLVMGGGSQNNPTLYSPVQQLWMLASRIPKGHEQVAAAICGFAKTQGTQIVQQQLSSTGTASAASQQSTTSSSNNNNPKAGVQVVADLLQFQDRLARLIAGLPNHEGVINLKNTWESVLNFELMAESLAKFLNGVLTNTKKMDQYQGNFNKIISGLFVPLTAKDVFEAFYKRDLAKRLLWNRIVSMDVEKSVCSLLKAECGAAYTSKMEGMFQDVDWSRETMMLYKQSSSQSDYDSNKNNKNDETMVSSSSLSPSSSPVEMEVQVLTTGYWPVYPQYAFHLPQLLLDPQERFENYYKNKYQGRRITWQYALGHTVVKANGFGKPYEFIVSLCQALVLLQFNEQTTWTLPDLLKQIGMEDRDEMERVLQSLSVAKEGSRILKKIDFDGSTKRKKPRTTVDDKDQFMIFEQFESNQRRIRVTNIMMKETKEEREKTVEAVSRDRLYLIDAVLVRILKARKTILHQNLLPQVLEQLRVPASNTDVKNRIESLIEREYMERDAKDRNRYNYLA